MLSTRHHERFWSSIRQIFTKYADTIARFPRWRHPLVGYLAGLLFVGLGLASGLLETQILSPVSFPGVFFMFGVVVVAFVWGVVPAIFTILLSLLVLDYLYVPPFGALGNYGWNGTLQLLTFTATGIVLVFLTHQREAAHVKAMAVEREAVLREQQLEAAEARANELALHEANRRMEEFLGIICHELKSPLTVMKGCLQLSERKVRKLLAAETPAPEEIRRFAPVLALLEQARNQCGVQDRLVNDLLDVSRIQMQTLKLLMENCDLTSIVQEVVEIQRQMVPIRTIHLTMPAQKELPVYGDIDRLAQVITNYLTNALKYSPDDQPINVCLSVEDQAAKVLVCDRGPGLAQEEQKRIWARFYRTPGIEGHRGTGVGLGVGLYICRTIIEQHGGQVGVQSSPGQGSQFWFTLPLSNE